MIDLIWPLAVLFVIAFASATLLWGGSEAALLAMAALADFSLMTLLIVASIGNILGSVLNYGLGRLALRYRDHKWFPVSRAATDKSVDWFNKWGQWSVLLAWAPVIGDPITVAAGALRMNFMRFLLLVSISKTVRYMAVLGAFSLVA